MEYDKLNNLLRVVDTSAKHVKVNNYLNLLLENMLELIVYLIHIMKIYQLDLKHSC